MEHTVQYEPRSSCELGRGPFAECRARWQKVIRPVDPETKQGEFDVFYCPGCQLGFTEPYPTEDTCGFLYENKDTSDFDVIRNSPIDYLKDRLAARMIRRLAPHDHVQAVLDYSAGNGRFALSAAQVFPAARVDAVDYQDEPPPLLKKQTSTSVNYVTVTEFARQEQRYDLIILRHALEHTHHPVQLLRTLGSRLAPEGQIYVEVPNLESGCARVFGKYWKGYAVPRHIFHFTTASLAETVRQAGLHPVIGRNEMPLMGNMFAILTGANRANLLVQGLGVLLHPAQLAIEAWNRSSTCINVLCRHPNK